MSAASCEAVQSTTRLPLKSVSRNWSAWRGRSLGGVAEQRRAARVAVPLEAVVVEDHLVGLGDAHHEVHPEVVERLALAELVGLVETRRLSPSCIMNSDPTTPVAPNAHREARVRQRERGVRRSAFVQSSFSTTMEIWRSDEPCEMQRMLTPALAIALVNIAPVPGRKAMPSPMATTEWPRST